MTTEIRHWFYPVNPTSKAYCLKDTETGEEVEISPENLLRNAEKKRGADDRWHLASGFRMMKKDDLIWIYVSGIQEICALASVRDVIEHDEGWEVLLSWDAPATRSLSVTPLTRIGIGNQRIQSVVPANANAVPVLNRWLMQHRQEVTSQVSSRGPREGPPLSVRDRLDRGCGRRGQSQGARSGERCVARSGRG